MRGKIYTKGPIRMKVAKLIKPIIYLVIGVLLCCSVINPDSLLNWFIALALLAGGLGMFILSFMGANAFLTDSGLSGAMLVGLGVCFIPALPGGVTISWMSVIAILMMCAGILFLLDSILGFVNKSAVSRNITILVIGAIAFAVGICLWLIPGFQRFAGLILGIFLIVYGVLLLVSEVTHKNIIIIDVSKKK